MSAMRTKTVTLASIALLAFAVTAALAPRGWSAAGGAAHAAPAGLENQLVALEKQSWEAWKNRDGKFFESFLSDDHVEVGFGGVTNKATVVGGVASPACVVSSYAVDHFKLTMIDPATAALTYRAEQNTTCGGRPVPSPVWVTSVYAKRGKRWLNVLYQQSALLSK